MTGLSDGVSKLWVVRARGGLQLEGYHNEIEAIDGLIRHALSFGPPDTRAKIEAAVADALKHRDEDDPPDSE